MSTYDLVGQNLSGVRDEEIWNCYRGSLMRLELRVYWKSPPTDVRMSTSDGPLTAIGRFDSTGS